MKIGDGHANAMLRLGLRELRGAVYPGAQSVAQGQEYGLYGTLTPGEVAQSRGENSIDLEQESVQKESVVADRLAAAQSRESRAPEREGPQLER